MNLTVAEVGELPLAAALLDGDEVVARTPEWRGPGPGVVAYRARRARFVVDTGGGDPVCMDVAARLLDALEGMASSASHRQALRVRMLAAGLRLLCGRSASAPGTSADVLEHACAGIAGRTAVAVAVDQQGAPFAVSDAAAAALVLVQFAANAERHDGATSLTLSAGGGVLAAAWPAGAARALPATARRRADRERWGLGYARLAADAIGAAVHEPVDEDGTRTALLEVGLERLALPLALVRDGAVVKSTRAWDEETGLPPGRTTPAGSRAGACVAAAARTPGTVAEVAGWTARSARTGTWVAIPPEPARDRARDVLTGLVHERALWEGVDEKRQMRVHALAAILGHLLGEPLERVPAPAWNARAGAAAAALGVRTPVPVVSGAGAVDPRVALYLVAEHGGWLRASGDDLLLESAPPGDVVLRALGARDGRLSLS